MKRIVIFSHGFAVKKDDRGLFTEIVDKLGDGFECVMFDYSDVDDKNNTLTVTPIFEQVEHLRKVVDKTKANNPGARIDIIAHSQGCLIVAMLKPENVKKTIFINPVTHFDEHKIIEYFGQRPGAIKNRHGTSQFIGSDGEKVVVPKECWDDMLSLNPQKNYHKYSRMTDLVVIHAKQDKLIQTISPEPIKAKAKHYYFDGDHSFMGKSRKPVIEKIIQELSI